VAVPQRAAPNRKGVWHGCGKGVVTQNVPSSNNGGTMNKPESLLSRLRSPFESRYGNFINGQWANPVNGKFFDNVSPVRWIGARPSLIRRGARVAERI
jgi:hypothetical protein